MARCEECLHFEVCAKECRMVQIDEHTWDDYNQLDNVEKFCANYIPTADVVPKSEVERLKAELDWIQARHPFAMTLFELEACEKHTAIKAVKEVWRELRSKCDAPYWCVWLSEIDDYFEKKTGVKIEDIAEFKKKYPEGEG